MGLRLARGCPDASHFSRAGDMPGGRRDCRLRDGSSASSGLWGAYGRSREDSKPRHAAWRLDRGPASARSSSGCQSPGSAGTHEPAARTLVITLAGNAKTYCARVGDRLRVDLRGTGAGPWLRPLVSGSALVPIPGAMTAGEVTSASFAAVQPGRVTVTAVRLPCQVAVPPGKNELEPADPLPSVYPLKSCPPGHRFSVLVIVQR